MFSRRNMLLLRACQVLPLEASPCRHSKVDVHEAARPFSEGRPRGPHSRLRRGAQGASQASGGNGRTTASAPVVAAFARDVDQHMRTRLADALRPHIPPSELSVAVDMFVATAQGVCGQEIDARARRAAVRFALEGMAPIRMARGSVVGPAAGPCRLPTPQARRSSPAPEWRGW